MTSLGGSRCPSAAAAARFRRTASARCLAASAVPARAFNASPLPKLPMRDGGGATVTPEEAEPAFVPREAERYDWRYGSTELKPLPPPPPGVADDPSVANPLVRGWVWWLGFLRGQGACVAWKAVGDPCGRSGWSGWGLGGWAPCSSGRGWW